MSLYLTSSRVGGGCRKLRVTWRTSWRFCRLPQPPLGSFGLNRQGAAHAHQYSSRILVLFIRDILLEVLTRRLMAVLTVSPIWSMVTWGLGSFTAFRSWLSNPVTSKTSPCSVYRKWSINLASLEHLDAILYRNGALVSWFCRSV